MTQFFPTLIPYRSGEKWGFSDREKNIKIDLNYDQTYPFVGDIARVTKNGLSGLIDRNGNEILPAAYEEVGSIITGTFMNDNGTCTIYHQGTYGLVSVHGKILADVTFSSETDAFSYAVNKGWKGAVASSQHPEMPGGVIRKLEAIKPYQDGIAPFKRQGCWGLISRQGKVVCDERYDDIEAAENGDWPFKKSEKWGLLDSSGQEIIPPEFDQIRGFSNGQAACKNGKLWGAIDRSGKWMIDPQFSEMGELRDGLVAAQKDGQFGFVNDQGHVVIDFQFQDVMDFNNGVCCVFENEFIYFIDTEGKTVSERFVRMFGPDEWGFTHVMSNDKWGLVKPDGQFILPIAYDLPRAMGQVLHTIEADRIPIKKGPFLGYADMEGKEIVPPKYVVIDPYCEGLSLVSIPDEQLNFGKTPEEMEASGSISGVFRYGFIDRAGKEVIPPQYQLAHRFEYGLAFVQTDGGAGYITYDGTEYFENEW